MVFDFHCLAYFFILLDYLTFMLTFLNDNVEKNTIISLNIDLAIFSAFDMLRKLTLL